MKDRGRIRLLRMICAVITIACLLPVGQSCFRSIRHERQQRQMREQKRAGDDAYMGQEGPKQEAAKQGEAGAQETGGDEPMLLPALQSFYEENSDLVGWLTVEGTKIDYPVMQCEDDEYYLNHNFQGEEDKYGSLFVKSIADIGTPGTNVIIYGHHMKDDAMFGELDRYESQSFCKEHGKVLFDTLFEAREYEVMAAFRTQVSESAEDGGFRYYQFYEADTKKEFNEFYDNVKKLSIYDTGVTAEFGDTFLTLSTCSGHTENGRFVVVAKRVGK